MNKNKTDGFSILEIAIVLLVIGTLIATALGAKPLITNAKTSRTINQLKSYQSAFQLYENTHNAMPGDDNLAAKRFSSIAGTNLHEDRDRTLILSEANLAWIHLIAAAQCQIKDE